MACDIIFSTAWRCGDKDCKAQWHKSNYWIDDSAETGYTVDTFADGDHQEVEEADLPKHEEIEAGWLEYSKHVAATGEDPLGEFYVQQRTYKRKERWQFMFADTILGPVLLQARRAGKVFFRGDIPVPKHVKDYLNLGDNPRGRLGDFKTWADLVEALPTVKHGRWYTDHIMHDVPRKADVAALKALARRHIRRSKTGK